MADMNVIFAHGEKGGVGKSELGRALHALFPKHWVTAVIDADPTNRDVYDTTEGAHKALVNIGTQEGWVDFANHLEAFKAAGVEVVVVSLPAAASEKIEQHARLIGLMVQELNANVCVAWLLSETKLSVDLLGKLGDNWDFMSHLVIVKNRHFGSDFRHWGKSKLRKELLSEGAEECDFPNLGDSGKEARDGTGSFGGRMVLHDWKKEALEALEPILEWAGNQRTEAT